MEWSITAFYFVIVLLTIVSAMFLYDAMRRLRKHIQQHIDFEVTLSKMRLLGFLVFFRTITFSVGALFLCLEFLDPSITP